MADEHPLVQLARKTIDLFVHEHRRLRPEEAPPGIDVARAGAFVTLHTASTGQLRGCIGTIQPMEDSIVEEVINNAISAATQDPRFPPVSPAELHDLTIEVSVLHQPEPIESIDDLDPAVYGVIVQQGWRRGLLLPDIEGIDTAEMQVRYARMKAGIAPHADVTLQRFQVDKYV